MLATGLHDLVIGQYFSPTVGEEVVVTTTVKISHNTNHSITEK